MDTPADRLRAARRRAGYLSAAEAAISLGVAVPTYAHHENGTRGFARHAAHYAKRFRVPVEWLLTGEGTPPASGLSPDDRATPIAPINDISLPRDLPIMGIAAAAYIGAVTMGRAIGYEMRPPSLLHVPDAYALYVAGDSMEPRYRPGDIVFVHPHRPARAGDDVVVQVRLNPSDEITGYVKTFVRRSRESVVCEQFNPVSQIEYRANTVIALHRVLSARELIQG